MASEAQKDGFSCPDAPVLPNECWALYISQPVPRKVMGRMEQAISSCIHRDKYATYIFKKHNIKEAQLDKIETEDPRLFLKQLTPHKRVSIIKLIHGWNPYNLFLYRQKRSASPNCIRCGTAIECKEHSLWCPNISAAQARYNLFQATTLTLHEKNIHSEIVTAIHLKLFQYLRLGVITMPQFSTPILEAIHHQNIIG